MPETIEKLGDITGLTLSIGDWIAYPTRFSSSMWMNIGRITRTYPLRVRRYDKNQDGRWIPNRRISTGIRIDRIVKTSQPVFLGDLGA